MKPIFLQGVFLQYLRVILRGILNRLVLIIFWLEIFVVETDVVYEITDTRVLRHLLLKEIGLAFQ